MAKTCIRFISTFCHGSTPATTLRVVALSERFVTRDTGMRQSEHHPDAYVRHPHGHGGNTKEQALQVFGLMNASDRKSESCVEVLPGGGSKKDEHHRQLVEQHRAATRTRKTVPVHGVEGAELDVTMVV